MQVYGQLQNAALEILSADPSTAVQGRVWFNSTTLKIMADDGTNKRALLRNDQACVFGNSGTAGNNIRLQRGGASVLQFVTGSDTTAEGSLSTSLAQISAKFEAYSLAGKPAAGNPGRIIWVTDNTSLYVDLGASWVPVATGAAITGPMMANQTITQTQMASNSIGTAQIINGNVTSAKLDATIQAVSTQSPATYTFTGSMTAVPGLSSTITSTGRPALVALTGGALQVTSGNAQVEIRRNGSAIASYNVAGNVNMPSSFISYVDISPPAGSNTYTIAAQLGSTTAQLSSSQLYVLEYR